MSEEIITPTETTEVISASASEPQSTPAEGAAPELQAQSTESAIGAPAEGTTPIEAPPAYQPNFKYRVMGEERELDPRLHGIIKSKEDEEWIKKIFARSDGLEYVLESRQKIADKYNALSEQVDLVIKAANAGDYRSVLEAAGVNTQDIGSVLSGLGYSKQEIIQYAYDLARQTPEQEAYFKRQRELEIRNRLLEQELDNTKQASYQARVDARTQELNQVLESPEIKPIKEAFDAYHGQGAFWEEVRRRGILHFAMSGKDISVQQAVQEVVNLIKFQSAQAPQPNPAQTLQPAPKKPDEVPVIPSVGTGGPQAPTRKRVKSIDDLRRLAKDLTD